MKYLFGLLLIFFFPDQAFVQESNYSEKEFLNYFNRVKVTTEIHDILWDKNIYGPILLVDPVSREIFANQPDAEENLKLSNGVYKGELPREIPVANTDIEWSGTHWAMIMLPLKGNSFDIVDLITHELFHTAQPSLGFNIRREDNSHLDMREGRIYLRLEIAALQAALEGSRLSSSEEHLKKCIALQKIQTYDL